MPRLRTSSETKQEEPTAVVVPMWLDDGHPNSEYFPKDDTGFEAFQAALDEKNLWGDYFGKLYRVRPLRNPNDKPARVAKFASTMTLEHIRKTYGGRKWSVYLSRRVGTRDKMIGVFQFDIEAPAVWQDGEGDTETPPGTPAGHTQGEQQQVFALFERLLTDVLKQRDSATAEGKGFNPGDAFKAALDTQKDSAKQAIEFVREQSKGSDGGMVSVLTTLLEKVLDKKESKSESVLLEKLIERMFAQPPDPLEQLNQILNIAEKIHGGKPGAGPNWANVAEKFLDRAPEILDRGIGLMDAAAAQAAQRPRPVPIRPAQLATAPAPMTPAMTPDSLHARATPSAGLGSATDEDREQIVIAHLKATIAAMVLSGDSGDVAAQTADLIAPDYADELAELMRSNPAALLQDPIFAPCKNAPKLREFIADFLKWFADQDEQESEPLTRAEASTAV